MRAIDADALQLAIVEEGQANKRKKYIIGDIWELTGAEIREVINSQPTIQPEPKRGKWNRLDMDTLNCNKCGATFVLNQGSEKMHFCPNCGADMRQKGENSESN